MRILFVALFMLISFGVHAGNHVDPVTGNIELTDKDGIEAAKSIYNLQDSMSDRVMSCIDKQNGKMEGCTCESRSKCPFKEEFEAYISAFCDAVKKHPDWKKYNLWYLDGKSPEVGYTIGTKNMYKHYGSECK